MGDWTDTSVHQALVKTGWYQRLVLLEIVPAQGKCRHRVSEHQTWSPVVMVSPSFWTGAGIFQQSVPDSRPNNFYSFLMFSWLLFLFTCLPAESWCWDVMIARGRLSGWHGSTAARSHFGPPTHISDVGVLTKGKFNNSHSKCKPRAPLLLSPASVLQFCSH